MTNAYVSPEIAGVFVRRFKAAIIWSYPVLSLKDFRGAQSMVVRKIKLAPLRSLARSTATSQGQADQYARGFDSRPQILRANRSCPEPLPGCILQTRQSNQQYALVE